MQGTSGTIAGRVFDYLFRVFTWVVLDTLVRASQAAARRRLWDPVCLGLECMGLECIFGRGYTPARVYPGSGDRPLWVACLMMLLIPVSAFRAGSGSVWALSRV